MPLRLQNVPHFEKDSESGGRNARCETDSPISDVACYQTQSPPLTVRLVV